MQSLPLMSVVIATFNRRDTLRTTLNRLALQSVPLASCEVLVIDDGSTDGTGKMVESLICSIPYSLRYFWHENRGPGYTQNRGIREAHSNLVLLMADDIWAVPGLLEQHIKSHNEHPEENIAVLGKVLQSPELPQTVMNKNWNPFRYDQFDGKRELYSLCFLACNISVKKNFLIKNGIYRERRGPAHEDIELGYRLGQKGLRILYNENALAYHYHETTLSGACRRAYERGRNFDMLSENIPKSLIFPLYHILSFEAGFKAYIKMLPREIPRKCLFNKWLVNGFWFPVLKKAETSRVARLFANQITYRGVVGYHQRKGYKDMINENQGAIVTKKVASQKR